tara:strand:- start:5487 stop:6125 length:639 start_codon:yes stop_codon:yes gene_type:complete
VQHWGANRNPRPATHKPNYTNAKSDLDELLQWNGQADAVLDALHQYQRASAARASAVDAHDTCARGRRVHPDGYRAWWRVPAEEAAVDLEGPRIVFVWIHKHHHTILADVVSAGQVVLRYPAHTTETRAAALDARPPTLKTREVVCVDAGCRPACNELLEVVGQVLFDHADQAAPQNEVVGLFERKDARLAHLKQGRPVEYVEDILAIENCS